jgi:hypothetical protein
MLTRPLTQLSIFDEVNYRYSIDRFAVVDGGSGRFSRRPIRCENCRTKLRFRSVEQINIASGPLCSAVCCCICTICCCCLVVVATTNQISAMFNSLLRIIGNRSLLSQCSMRKMWRRRQCSPIHDTLPWNVIKTRKGISK